MGEYFYISPKSTTSKGVAIMVIACEKKDQSTEYSFDFYNNNQILVEEDLLFV
jgi:hypothetical protein